MSPPRPPATSDDPHSASPAHANTSLGIQATGASGCVDSAELLRGQKTVAISHNGSTYRLQATRLGKLILTK